MLEMRHPTAEESTQPESTEAAIAMECPAGSVVMWDGRVWHGSFARETEGERVVLHATYYRLLMRPHEAYTEEVADTLCTQWGAQMSSLLGREDYIQKVDIMTDPRFMEKFATTMRNVRS